MALIMKQQIINTLKTQTFDMKQGNSLALFIKVHNQESETDVEKFLRRVLCSTVLFIGNCDYLVLRYSLLFIYFLT